MTVFCCRPDDDGSAFRVGLVSCFLLLLLLLLLFRLLFLVPNSECSSIAEGRAAPAD